MGVIWLPCAHRACEAIFPCHAAPSFQGACVRLSCQTCEVSGDCISKLARHPGDCLAELARPALGIIKIEGSDLCLGELDDDLSIQEHHGCHRNPCILLTKLDGTTWQW